MEVLGTKITLTMMLALWGATLSTVLGLLRIFDAWRNRFRVNVDYVWRSDPYEGDEISIQNLSGKPILLTHLKVHEKDKKCLWHPEDTLLQKRIESFETERFVFSESDFFHAMGKRIVVELHFAGRKPLFKSVGN